MNMEEFKEKYEELKKNPMYQKYCSVLETKDKIINKLQQENQKLKEDIKGYEQERQKIYNSIPFKENKQLKEQVEYLRRSCERKEDTIIDLQQDLTIIDELEKWCKSFTTEEFNYNFLVVRIKDILDKISELKGEKNE